MQAASRKKPIRDKCFVCRDFGAELFTHAERANSRPNGRRSDQAISAPAALILMRSPDLPHSKSFLCSVEEAASSPSPAALAR